MPGLRPLRLHLLQALHAREDRIYAYLQRALEDHESSNSQELDLAKV